MAPVARGKARNNPRRSDELQNRKVKTCPKVLDIKGHLVWRRVVNPTLNPRGEELELLRDTVLLPELFDICLRK